MLGTVGYIGRSMMHFVLFDSFAHRKLKGASIAALQLLAAIAKRQPSSIKKVYDTKRLPARAMYLCIVLLDSACAAIQLQPSRHRSQSSLHAVRGDDVVTSYLVQLLQELGAGDSITPSELLPALLFKTSAAACLLPSLHPSIEVSSLSFTLQPHHRHHDRRPIRRGP